MILRCIKMQCGIYYLLLFICTVQSQRKKQTKNHFKTNKCRFLRSCHPTCSESWGSRRIFSSLCDHLSSLRVWLDACLLRNYRPISHHFLIASHAATPTQWSHKSASRGSVGSSTLDMKLAVSLPSDLWEAVHRKCEQRLDQALQKSPHHVWMKIAAQLSAPICLFPPMWSQMNVRSQKWGWSCQHLCTVSVSPPAGLFPPLKTALM